MADIVEINLEDQSTRRSWFCDSVKSLLKSAVAKLKGSTRRQLMEETVLKLGPGGQAIVERELGWNRVTIRK